MKPINVTRRNTSTCFAVSNVELYYSDTYQWQNKVRFIFRFSDYNFLFYCTCQTQHFLVSRACLFKDTVFCTKTNIYNGRLRRTVQFHCSEQQCQQKYVFWKMKTKMPMQESKVHILYIALGRDENGSSLRRSLISETILTRCVQKVRSGLALELKVKEKINTHPNEHSQ